LTSERHVTAAQKVIHNEDEINIGVDYIQNYGPT
jgi:hypothetical protein